MSSTRYFRRVLKITAEMSPNVRYARAQIARGLQPTDEVVVPGVLPWSLYLRRRATWDKARQSIGLDGEFYRGSELMLWPEEWLKHSAILYKALVNKGVRRQAEAIGIDPAEGGDKTAMAAVDKYGVIAIESRKTPNTAEITSEALGFMRFYGVRSENVLFDLGGGGKQHVDRLRAQGFKVRGVAFGESITPELKKTHNRIEPYAGRLEMKEDRYVYRYRRDEMYGEMSLLCDPTGDNLGWAIPDEGEHFIELRRQLANIPKCYDKEGRLSIPPKSRNRGQEETKIKTLREILGCSPDEADAVALAVHGMLHPAKKVLMGAI